MRVCTGTEGGEEEQLGQGGQSTAGSRDAAYLYDVSLRRWGSCECVPCVSLSASAQELPKL